MTLSTFYNVQSFFCLGRVALFLGSSLKITLSIAIFNKTILNIRLEQNNLISYLNSLKGLKVLLSTHFDLTCSPPFLYSTFL